MSTRGKKSPVAKLVDASELPVDIATASVPEGTPAAVVAAPPHLHAVAEPDLEQVEWQRLELEARAERLGVSVKDLEPAAPPDENWRQFLPQAAPPANPVYAGLYHLRGGCVQMTDGVAVAGSYVRLGPTDGEHVTKRGIGVRVGK